MTSSISRRSSIALDPSFEIARLGHGASTALSALAGNCGRTSWTKRCICSRMASVVGPGGIASSRCCTPSSAMRAMSSTTFATGPTPGGAVGVVLVVDEEPHLMGQRHFRRVAALGDRQLAQLLPLVADLVVLEVDGEPAVAEARRAPQRELGVAADPDRDRAADRLRQEVQPGLQLVVLALERRRRRMSTARA